MTLGFILFAFFCTIVFFSVFISTNKNCFCDSPCFYWILHYIFASASSKPISFMINFNIYLHIFLIHVHFFPYRFTRFVVNLMWILDILHKCNWFQTLRNAKKSTSFIAIAQLHLHNFLFMFFCIKIQILWSKKNHSYFCISFFILLHSYFTIANRHTQHFHPHTPHLHTKTCRHFYRSFRRTVNRMQE